MKHSRVARLKLDADPELLNMVVELKQPSTNEPFIRPPLFRLMLSDTIDHLINNVLAAAADYSEAEEQLSVTYNADKTENTGLIVHH
jgi:hypothetical protein